MTLTRSISADGEWMRRCCALALRGAGAVSPNPLVGAVIVRGGQLLGKGYHQQFGGPHAEVLALTDARRRGRDVRGATMYVNLEPCSHFGKTPPCADAIIRAGIGRVVAALKDPNPMVAGRGIARLRNAGIRVRTGVGAREARLLNEAYLTYATTGLPFVALKFARTRDGFIARPDGSSRWISSRASRVLVHRLRARYDAVLIGSGTVVRDNPRLTVRMVRGRHPLRVVLSGSLRLPLRSAVLCDRHRERTIVYTCDAAETTSRAERIREQGVTVVGLRGVDGRVTLTDVLADLGRRGVSSVLVEGGQLVLDQFVAEGRAHKVYEFVAPRDFGTGLTAFRPGTPPPALVKKVVRRAGSDLFVEGYFRHA